MWDEIAALAWLDPSLITRQRPVFMDIDIDHGAGYGNTLSWAPGNNPGLGEQQVTVQEDVPFALRLQADPNLDRSHQIVVTPGEPGRVENTYLVHLVDGRETTRVLLASEELAAPVTELRRIGTRTPPASSEIEAIIREAAAAQGADPEQLLRVAYCESRFNPGAYNASGASGLFQFLPSTWAANSVRAGYAGASVFDAVASANVAAWMFAHGQAFQWVCR